MVVARKTALLFAFLAPVCGVTAKFQLKRRVGGVAPSGFNSLVDAFEDEDDAEYDKKPCALDMGADDEKGVGDW